MRFIPSLLCILLVTSCGRPDDVPEADDTAGAETAATSNVTGLTDFAGSWQTTSRLEDAPDTVRSTLTGSADGTDWTLTLEGRDPIPLRASVVGDSLIAESVQPYESVRRPGVMVTLRVAGALQPDGSMAGNLLATYQTSSGVEQVRGTFVSTRM